MKNFRKFSKIAALLFCGILAFGGCGKDSSDGDSGKTPDGGSNAVSDTEQQMAYKDIRYLPEFTDTSENYGAYTTVSLGVADDTFYLIKGERLGYNYYMSNCKLIAFNPDTGEEKELLYEADIDAKIITGAPLDDGSIIMLLKTDVDAAEYMLYKIDADGNEIFSKECSGASIPEESRDIQLAADSQGRCCLLTRENMFLFDEEGGFLGKIDLAGKRVRSMVRGNNGKVCVYELNTRQVVPVDFGTSSLEASSYSISVNMQQVLGTTNMADFLICDSTTVYRYRCEDGKPTPLFDLQDSQISDASYIKAMGEMKDGRIFIFCADETQDTTEAALLTPTPLDECPVKDVITIGTVNPSRDLMENAATFNRQNKDINVSIVNYRVGGRDFSEAKQALNLDISIGKGPDICVLDYLDNTESLLSGGYFLDLSAYLDGSRQYKKEDFIKQALDAYTYQDQLMALPKYFTLRTIVGKAEVVGDSMGWNLEDVKTVVSDHPDAAMIFESRSSSYMLDVCIRNMLDEFVDLDKKKADFDSSEYIDFLNFINDLPNAFNEDEYLIYGNEWLREGRALLSVRNIKMFTDLQEMEAVFGGKYTCIGYPSPDKTPDCIITGYDNYAISANSSRQDGAWEFIEWSQSTQGEEKYSDIYRMGFPTRTIVFEQELEKAMNEAQMGWITFSDGTSVEYRKMTPEESDLLHSLIEIARPEGSVEQVILGIMEEDAADLFKGDKSAEDVAEVTQNRVQLYLDEG